MLGTHKQNHTPQYNKNKKTQNNNHVTVKQTTTKHKPQHNTASTSKRKKKTVRPEKVRTIKKTRNRESKSVQTGRCQNITKKR